MLRIRLSRTGRKNYPSYRIVVAEHSAPIKGKFIDILGHYIPSREPKVLEYDEKKIKEWISKGAKPTDTLASLLKNAGMGGMDEYIEPRDKKKKKKKEMKAEATAEGGAPAKAPAEEGSKPEAGKPAEEAPAPEGEEPPKEEEKKEEPKPEPKEKPAEEPPKEKEKKEEPKPEPKEKKES